MKEKSFIITENTESINALKTMKVFIDTLEEDLYSWKWIIIVAHNCLQNFMVSSLRNGNNMKILEKKSTKDWHNEFIKRMKTKIEDWESPREKLDLFLNIYKKIKSNKMLISKKLEADKKKDEAIEWLIMHRNQFIHFVPSTFLIHVIDFPKRMILIMEIIKFLVSESNNIIWLNNRDKILAEKLINELIENFEKLDQNYALEAKTT